MISPCCLMMRVRSLQLVGRSLQCRTLLGLREDPFRHPAEVFQLN
jgi:hypothetical protein